MVSSLMQVESDQTGCNWSVAAMSGPFSCGATGSSQADKIIETFKAQYIFASWTDSPCPVPDILAKKSSMNVPAHLIIGSIVMIFGVLASITARKRGLNGKPWHCLWGIILGPLGIAVLLLAPREWLSSEWPLLGRKPTSICAWIARFNSPLYPGGLNRSTQHPLEIVLPGCQARGFCRRVWRACEAAAAEKRSDTSKNSFCAGNPCLNKRSGCQLSTVASNPIDKHSV